jgi:eukaryotic-like serine/threonine-protein kinase
MPTTDTSFGARLRSRLRASGRWIGPVLRSHVFWLGLLAVVGALAGLYLLFNSVVMPAYTRQGVQVTVPEVRELSYAEAARLLDSRRLRPERRDQPFNPAFPRDVVVDQNPGPNASVKPGRRIYLYVNSGTERSVSMPEVRTLTESLARSQLGELGIASVQILADERPSPYPGTVTRQQPEAGETIRTSDQVTLWVSPGVGEGIVEVPDVRGLSAELATQALLDAGLWVDPTRGISGTVTRIEPGAGSAVRRGTEVRISSAPIDEEPAEEPPFGEEPVEAIPYDEPEFEEAPPPRDADRRDW